MAGGIKDMSSHPSDGPLLVHQEYCDIYVKLIEMIQSLLKWVEIECFKVYQEIVDSNIICLIQV